MPANLNHQVRTTINSIRKRARKRRYLLGGRIPWTVGYLDYRSDFIRDALADDEMLLRFARTQPLPPGYGLRLDERVVEYPWVISRLTDRESPLLDAGSTLNFEFLLGLRALEKKTIVIYTLAPELNPPARGNVSHIYGDLRRTILRDRTFEEIVCISTLEHVGMDNTQIYTSDRRFNESRPQGYRDVLREFQRLLAPGGHLFVTVPYGKHQNYGWLQQFDREMLRDALEVFNGTFVDAAYYRYTADGWALASALDCSECEYYNIHTRVGFDSDYAAAARAVACLELRR